MVPFGTTGPIVGGIGSGILGDIVAPGGSKMTGRIIGTAAGDVIRKSADDSNIVYR